MEEPPPAATLVPKDPAQQTLVGRSLLYCWPSVVWCVGIIKEANGDRRFKMDGEVVTFYVHYEIDDDTSSSSTSTATTRLTRGYCWRRARRGCRAVRRCGVWGTGSTRDKRPRGYLGLRVISYFLSVELEYSGS